VGATEPYVEELKWWNPPTTNPNPWRHFYSQNLARLLEATSQIIVKHTKMAVREKELSERLNLKITND